MDGDRGQDSGKPGRGHGMQAAVLLCVVVAVLGVGLVLAGPSPMGTIAQVPPTATPRTPPGGRVTETPTPTPTDTPTPTPTATPTNTRTPTPTRTARPTITPTATSTEEPRPTPTPTATDTPVIIDIATPTPTPTVPIATVPPSDPPIAVPTPTSTPLGLVVPTPTNTPLSIGVPTFTPTTGAFQGPGASQVDYSAWAMEVTQGIQNLANQMPLVAGRLTAVRLYVKVEPDVPDSDVTGALGGWRDGKFLGVLYPENGPIIAAASGGVRTAINHSLYFYLPYSWAAGDVKLKGVVFAGGPATLKFEPNSANNYFEVDVAFQTAQPLKVRLAPIHTHAQPSPNSPETTFLYQDNQAVALQVLLGLYRLHPIAELQWDTSLEFPQEYVAFEIAGQPVAFEWTVTGPIQPLDHPSGGEFDESTSAGRHAVNLAMALIRMWSPPEYADFRWYGMVPAAHPMGGFIGWASYDVAHGIMSNATDTAAWNVVGGVGIAHELAHFIVPGPDHNNCSGTEEAGGGLDPAWPYPSPDCSMSAVDPEGYYGFDVYWPFWGNLLNGPTVISNDPSQADPQRGFPLMGYAKPWWADPYNYCKLLDEYGIACDETAINVRGLGMDGRQVAVEPSHYQVSTAHRSVDARVLPHVAEGKYAMVAGAVGEGAGGRIDVVLQINHPSAHVVEESRQQILAMAGVPERARLVIEDGAGRELASYRLANIDPTAHGALPDGVTFAVVVPWPDGAAKVAIRRGGDEVAARTASANPPTVRLTTTNGGGSLPIPAEIAWEAADPDGDQLSFSVLYSDDDGQTWRALAAEVRASKLRLPTTKGLPGTDRGRFKVVASDGFHTAEDISDRAFRVPNSPPSVAILSPINGTEYTQGATVGLSGSASDLEDLPELPDRLRWSSSLDGDLGEGAKLLVRDLRPGKHRITFSARDSDGATAKAEVEITITGEGRVRLPSDDDEGEILRLLGEEDDRGPGLLVWLGAGAAVLAGAAGAGLWFLRSRIRRPAAEPDSPPA